MTLHERIEILMKKQKVSKAELARRLNKSYSTIDNWFKRNSFPSSETIEEIAKALNVSAQYLITGNELSTENLTSEEQKLIQYFQSSNSEGKSRIMEQAEFLSKKHPSNLVNSKTESA